MTAAEAPDEARRLRAEIEQTREHLGATVEELAAKVDVKNRAQAKVAELRGQVTWQAKGVAAQARKLVKRAGKQAGQHASAVTATTTGARQRAIAAGQAAPAPVRQAAAKGADTARKYRGPLSAAGTAGLLALIAFVIWHRRKR